MLHMEVDKIVLFHFLDLFVLSTFLLCKPCGGDYSCRWFVLQLIELTQDEDMATSRVQRGRSSLSASCPDEKHGNSFSGLSEEPGGSVALLSVCVLRTIVQKQIFIKCGTVMCDKPL
jgi:hypothetical protein